MAAFDRLGLMPELCQATEEMGWILPTEVQDEAIPLILGGGDVMIAAETGSGKTGAFGLPLLQIVYETLNGKGQAVTESKAADVDVSERFQLNKNDRDTQLVAVSEDFLTCQARHDKAWGGIRANKAITTGRFYYEITVADDGLCRVGWATASARYEIGTDKESFGYGGTGKKAFGRNFENYGVLFAKGDVVGCMLDRVSQTISFSKYGTDLGVAFDIPKNLQRTGLFPAVTLKNCEVRFNFGETPFKHLPSGFTGAFQAQQGECVGFQAKSAAAKQSNSDAVHKNPLALILEPTRELAQQVYDEITKFKAVLPGAPIKHECFIGGGNFSGMMQSLKDGLQIVIGTPGRLQDLIKSGKMSLAECRYFVLDEADRLMDTGNDKDIRNIFDKLPKEKGVQVIICSATLHSPEITKLADQIAFHPTWVDLKGKDSVPDSVDHAIIKIDPRTDLVWESAAAPEVTTDGIHQRDKTGSKVKSPESISEGIKKLKPHVLLRVIEAFKMDQCMIFCRTQVDCDNLEQFLLRAGGGQKWRQGQVSGVENKLSCVVLHSGRQQRERTENLEGFKDGSVKFLICTDVAARGIDIQQLPYVINMTLPHEAEEYIHRIGRVGRADSVGLAISLVSVQDKEKVWWHNCNRKDRGRSCTKTQLTDAGGCAIWFDEAKVLSEIETRLGGVKIPAMDPNNLTAGREDFMRRAAAGTLAKNDEVSKESALHIDILRPAAQELSELEFSAQVSFHSMATGDKWANMLKQT